MHSKMSVLLSAVFLVVIGLPFMIFAETAEVLVKPVAVQKLEFFERYVAIGKCQSERSRGYFSKVNGKIEAITVTQDQKVKQGDVLIQIDPEIAESIKSKADANLHVAQDNYDRDESLFKKNIINQAAVHKSYATLQTAKADFISALNQYNNMMITAPFDGRVGVIHATVGQDIKIKDYLFTITTPGDQLVLVALPEYLGQKIDNNSEVFLLDKKLNRIPGKIKNLSNYVNDQGTITAEMLFPYTEQVMHGSYVEVEIIFDHHTVYAVPEKAVLKNNQGNFVYTITDNKVEQVYVMTGTRMNHMIEILSDQLNEKTQIVLEGLTKVSDGSSVSFIKSNQTE